MPVADILLPTCGRPDALVMTLAGIAAQTATDIRLIVAEQDGDDSGRPVVASLLRMIEARGGCTEWHARPQVHGIAEQRDFLLRRANARAVLYLDDDVFMESPVVARLLTTLEQEPSCAFVGVFPTGLSFADDLRPDQERIEFWEGPVTPETIEPGGDDWEARWQLHRAANAYHVARRLDQDVERRYKIAWVPCCVIYDRRKLIDAGGFGFWPRLPRFHSGEEVLVQNLLMRRWGGCAILPSGAYHAELPSTVLNERGAVDGHALALLDEALGMPEPRCWIS
ncbi:MAG TPA: glycosyltransferase family A protein [Dehalococcoidia bacterium]